MTRTWSEQQQHEFDVRKGWLEKIARLDMPVTEMARTIGMDRSQFIKMAEKYGVGLNAGQAEAQRQREAREREEQHRRRAEKEAREKAQRELERRKQRLLKEGYSEKQALRAVAWQMGVLGQPGAQERHK
jgi:hypothetical protein